MNKLLTLGLALLLGASVTACATKQTTPLPQPTFRYGLSNAWISPEQAEADVVGHAKYYAAKEIQAREWKAAQEARAKRDAEDEAKKRAAWAKLTPAQQAAAREREWWEETLRIAAEYQAKRAVLEAMERAQERQALARDIAREINASAPIRSSAPSSVYFAPSIVGTPSVPGGITYYHVNGNTTATAIDLGGGMTTFSDNRGNTATSMDLGGGYTTYRDSRGNSGNVMDLGGGFKTYNFTGPDFNGR